MTSITSAKDLDVSGLQRLQHMGVRFDEWFEHWDSLHKGAVKTFLPTKTGRLRYEAQTAAMTCPRSSGLAYGAKPDMR